LQLDACSLSQAAINLCAFLPHSGALLFKARIFRENRYLHVISFWVRNAFKVQ
jgi:hypothetical protein